MAYERTSSPAENCPCSQGSVIRHTESPEHPFGSCSFSFTLDCPQCEPDYFVEHHFVYRRATRAAVDLARAALKKSEKKLEAAIAAAIDQIVTESASTFREEHDLLKNARVCTEGPRNYKWAREAGSAASELCNCSPFTNIEWIKGQLPKGEVCLALTQALADYDKHLKLSSKASKLDKPVITASKH